MIEFCCRQLMVCSFYSSRNCSISRKALNMQPYFFLISRSCGTLNPKVKPSLLSTHPNASSRGCVLISLLIRSLCIALFDFCDFRTSLLCNSQPVEVGLFSIFYNGLLLFLNENTAFYCQGHRACVSTFGWINFRDR
ncbi:hypothetical protein PISMIDRAFT_283405 [Pisolithus microcarpus 441]|uniref:Uncharacterized protein n=1 Tax=Pisolithus microcarpus 441 TaxID=765257 RepID=A0A0C9YMA8_9AGAM|nr:hypothetical protein PISMIDRAFT_283405 [Pisolithus microcarpus 441]